LAGPNTSFDQITAITNDVFLPQLPDLVFDASPLMKLLHKGGSKPQGGAAIRQPVMYQFSQDGAYTDYEKGNTSAEDQVTAAEFPWKLYRQRIVISEPELHRNDGPEAVFRLLKAKMTGAATAIRDALSTDMVVSTYGDSSKQINSLDNILGDGTYPSTPTISGGIDKATAANAFWRGTNSDYDTGTCGYVAPMLTAWYAVIDGEHTPKVIVSHPTALANHQSQSGIASAGERYVNTQTMDSGFVTFTFQGKPWLTDRHVTAASGNDTGVLYMLDTDFIDFVSHKNRNFTFRKFQQPDDQDVNIGWIHWMGNLTASDPSRSCIMYS
jgi:hypothetical protein